MEKTKESNVERLRNGILDLIQELNLSLGDKLPTEKVMAERFQVSRPTLREALKLLEQDAVIDVHQGKGRFLAAGVALNIARPITKFESASDMVRSHGYKAKIHVLGFSTVPARSDIARELNLTEDDPVIRVERLRFSGDQPLIYSINWIPKFLFDRHNGNGVTWDDSIVTMLGEIEHRPVASTACVQATMLPIEIAELHGLQDFGPALLIQEVCYTSNGERVIFSQDYHRGSAFTFSFVRR
ncbi:GntR family transcriptional regulator [uncultured Thalassospira sp.]|jgi:GntR family transcriptional regulator|uniref:GntR family transcriptional regulator n=1 Tax=uncultured Thalassospira sp. TaxID=404382 RepID=UPI0030D82878|tara:strand:+ start:11139 stop:11864 length:726 start_codon:yes stop_codon:yes gene_type:complete